MLAYCSTGSAEDQMGRWQPSSTNYRTSVVGATYQVARRYQRGAFGRATGSPLQPCEYFGNFFLNAAILITYLELLMCLYG